MWQNTKAELDTMLDEYYELHGWDGETARPSAQVLGLLGLRDVVESG